MKFRAGIKELNALLELPELKYLQDLRQGIQGLFSSYLKSRRTRKIREQVFINLAVILMLQNISSIIVTQFYIYSFPDYLCYLLLGELNVVIKFT